MKFTSIIVAALATIAAAKPKFTNSNFDVVAGRSFELKWTDAKGPVTINLMSGKPPNGMKPFKLVASGLTGTSFVYDVPTDVPTGEYAFTVADGSSADDTNYSLPFSLVGTGSSSTTSSILTVSSTSSRATSSVTVTSTSATTMITTTSASVNSTATTSSGSSSTRASATTSPTTSPTAAIPNSNGAGKVQSSLALVMLGAVAYAFLN